MLGDKCDMMNVGHLLHLECSFGFIYRFICQVFHFCYYLITPHAEEQKEA